MSEAYLKVFGQVRGGVRPYNRMLATEGKGREPVSREGRIHIGLAVPYLPQRRMAGPMSPR